MTSRDFVYWLQGFMEVGDPKQLNARELDIIKRHLNMVFKHEIDPQMGNQQQQDALNHLHDPNNYGNDFTVRC